MSKVMEEIALIRMRISELKAKRAEILIKKKPIEAEMGQLKARLKSQQTHKTRLTPDEFRSICGRQAKLRNKIAEIEVTLNPINTEIRNLCSEEDCLRAGNGIALSNIHDYASRDMDLLRKISDIRDQWQQFAGDQTRVNSMRIMAAQFADQLTSALTS